MRILTGLVLTTASLLASQAWAASIDSDSLGRASITGTIAPEDVAKVEALYRTDHPPRVVWINSDGGDLNAAMAIGRLIRKSVGFVLVDKICASACVFILAGGASRAVEGNVVIHRPYLTAGPPVEGYDANYKRLAGIVRSYLSEMNMPPELGERLLATPPDEAEVLSLTELRQYTLDGQDPAYEQELAAKEAKRYGITLLEQRRRQALQNTVCGRWENGDGGAFEGAGRVYCDKAIMAGDDPAVVQFRTERVLQSRAEILGLPEAGQDNCIKEIMLGPAEKDCPWMKPGTNMFQDLIPKQH